MSIDSTSVSSVVAEISALVQEQQGGAEVHKLIQQIAEKATPGADGDYKSSMKVAIAAIEADVEPKILASHTETQSKLDAALSAFRSQAGSASVAFAAAKDIDKTYFECVATEQTLRQTVESAVQTHEAAKKSATAACNAQEEDRSFAFDATEGDYNFGLDCDLGDAEACQSQMAKLEEAVAKMEEDLTTAMGADQKRYNGLKAVCDRETIALAQAESALSAAEKRWSAKRLQCAKSVGGRREASCSFGTELVKKCELENNFNKLDAASREEGHAMSESDRVQEWKAARTTKCMLQKYMEKGLDGSVNSDLLTACNEDDDEMKLARQDVVAQQLKEGVRCTDGPITFANGQAWSVPEGLAPAVSSYSRVAYTPAFSVTSGFGFCGRTIGEQNVGGGDGPLGGGPLGQPLPWNLVFRQTFPTKFAKDQWSRNVGDPSNANYAILDQLEEYRVGGKFELKLVWPDSGLQDQTWRQTSNPVTKKSRGVDGYEAISAPYTANRWKGLENGLNTYALLDGSVDHGNWFYAVGSFRQWSSGFPGPQQAIKVVELFVRAATPPPVAAAVALPWNLVFRQTFPTKFAKDQWSRNVGDPSNANYAILDQLEEYRVGGKFELKLVWPDSGLQDQTWRQTSNPVTKKSRGVDGYEAISAPYTANRWKGLENGLNTYALLDGTVDHGNWFYAVGSFRQWSSGFPGPQQAIKVVELFVRAPQQFG